QEARALLLPSARRGHRVLLVDLLRVELAPAQAHGVAAEDVNRGVQLHRLGFRPPAPPVPSSARPSPARASPARPAPARRRRCARSWPAGAGPPRTTSRGGTERPRREALRPRLRTARRSQLRPAPSPSSRRRG